MNAMPAPLKRHAGQLAALGSPVRLAILRHVVQGEEAGTAVGEIQAKLGIPWSTLSHHLERLASAGLVKARPEGKFIYYRCDFEALRSLTRYVWQDCCNEGKARCC